MSDREFLPRLVFKHKVNGKEGLFLAIYNEELGGILLNGEIRSTLMIDELISFLGQVKDKMKKKTIDGVCECGSKDVMLIGEGIWHLAPLAGNEYEILRCNSCGREFKKITTHY